MAGWDVENGPTVQESADQINYTPGITHSHDGASSKGQRQNASNIYTWVGETTGDRWGEQVDGIT